MQMVITDHTAGFILYLVMVEKLIVWPQFERIHKLDDGIKLLKLIFEGSTGKHQGIRRTDLFNTLCDLCFPVLDPLGFVEDHYIEFNLVDRVKVITESVVGNYLVKSIRFILTPAYIREAFDDLDSS